MHFELSNEHANDPSPPMRAAPPDTQSDYDITLLPEDHKCPMTQHDYGGAPSTKWSVNTLNQIIELTATTPLSMEAIGRQIGVHRQTIVRWMAGDAAFGDAMARARVVRAHMLADNAQEIMDATVQQVSTQGLDDPKILQIWATQRHNQASKHLKLAGYYNPMYSDRPVVDVGVHIHQGDARDAAFEAAHKAIMANAEVVDEQPTPQDEE